MQVRTARAQHVEAPAPTGASVKELSREERESLRAVRHHAFQRHQRNAAWMRELVHHQSVSTPTDDTPTSDPSAALDVEKQRRLESEIALLKQAVVGEEQRIAADHARHTELLNALRSIDSEAALEACRSRIFEEASHHVQSAAKEPKVIKL